MGNPLSDETFRGWIYRLLVLGLIAYVFIVQPDRVEQWVPVLIGLGNGLAALNTPVSKQ